MIESIDLMVLLITFHLCPTLERQWPTYVDVELPNADEIP